MELGHHATGCWTFFWRAVDRAVAFTCSELLRNMADVPDRLLWCSWCFEKAYFNTVVRHSPSSAFIRLHVAFRIMTFSPCHGL